MQQSMFPNGLQWQLSDHSDGMHAQVALGRGVYFEHFISGNEDLYKFFAYYGMLSRPEIAELKWVARHRDPLGSSFRYRRTADGDRMHWY